MKNYLKLTLATLVCLIFYGPPVLAADIAEPVAPFGVQMLQEESITKERTQDPKALADYIAAVQAAIGPAVAKDQRHTPTSGFVVVALKPGGHSNAWIDFTPPLTPVLSAEVLTAARSVQPLQVHGGVILFALKVGFWGAAAPAAPAPGPEEWKTAAKKIGHPVNMDELMKTLWPD